MKKVFIAMSSDNRYAIPLLVALSSILKNKKKDTFYEFYLMVTSDFIYRDVIKKLEEKFNCKINFIDMGTQFINSPNKLSHTTNVSYYRLVLSEILPNIEKIIYLDTDTLILGDLSDLFDINISDYYLGGVIHPTYYFGKFKGYSDLLGIDSLDSYINAGVLLLNLKKIRENNIVEKFKTAVLNNYPAIDQDVINSVCFKHIKSLDYKYNVMPKTVSFLRDDKINELYSYKDFFNAFLHPIIIHFANASKPWNDKNNLFADKWVNYLNAIGYIYNSFDDEFKKRKINNE